MIAGASEKFVSLQTPDNPASPFEKGGERNEGAKGDFILKISPNPSFTKRGT
jgi:hypothetical protein